MAYVYGKPLQDVSWNIANSTLNRIRGNRFTEKGETFPGVIYTWDATPWNRRRGIHAKIFLTLDDIVRDGAMLAGSKADLITYIANAMQEQSNDETARADEAEKELAVVQGELAKAKEELEKLREAKGLRILGGAV